MASAELAAVLQAFLSEDPATRSQAEQSLSAGASQPGFAHQLTTALVDDAALPLHLRQTAGVLLHKLVKEHWVVGAEERAAVHERALAGLGLPQRQLRTTAAVLVAKVAGHDFPAAWPELPARLGELLQSGPEGLVGGLAAVRVLLEDVEMSQTLPLVQELFPLLLGALASPEVAPRTRAAVVVVLRTALANLMVLEHGVVAGIIRETVPPMLQAFAGVLVGFDAQTTDPALLNAVLATISQLVELYPKVMARVVDQLLPAVWNLTPPLLQAYHAAMVEGGPGADGDAYDEDGDNIGLNSVVMHLIALFGTIIGCPVPAVAGAIEQFMAHVLGAMAGFMEITDAQADEWQSDNSAYVRAEEEDSFVSNVRNEALALVGQAIEVFEDPALESVLELAQQLMAREGRGWKTAEVALFFAGLATDVVVVKATRGGEMETLQALAQTVLQCSGADAPALLRARALWTASTLCAHAWAPPELLTPFLPLVVAALQAQNPLTVRVAAVRAAGHMAVKLPAEAIAPSLPSIAADVMALAAAPEAADEATAFMLLDTVSELLIASPAATEAVHGAACEMAFGAWASGGADPLVAVCVTDIVRAVASVPASFAALASGGALAGIVAALGDADAHRAATAVALVGAVVGAQPHGSALPPDGPLLAEALPRVTQMCAASDDHQIVQNAAEALGAFARVCGAQIAGNAAALQAVLEALARVLDPRLSEDAALTAGAFAADVLLFMGAALGDDGARQVGAWMAARLRAAKLPLLSQAMLLAWARLIHADAAAALGMLDDAALAELLQRWSQLQLEVPSAYYQRVTTAALTRLLTFPDARLDAVAVEGDPVPSEGRARRSAGPARFQQVPFRHRAFVLLVRMGVRVRGEDGDDDLEYEDDFDLDDDGGPSPFVDADVLETDEDGNFLLSDQLGLGEELTGDDDVRRHPGIERDPLNDVDVEQMLADFFRAADPQQVAQGTQLLAPDEVEVLQSWLGGAGAGQ